MRVIFHYRIKAKVAGHLEVEIKASLKNSEIAKSREILGFGIKEQGVWKVMVDKEFLGEEGLTDFNNNVAELIKECFHPDVKIRVEIL